MTPVLNRRPGTPVAKISVSSLLVRKCGAEDAASGDVANSTAHQGGSIMRRRLGAEQDPNAIAESMVVESSDMSCPAGSQ